MKKQIALNEINRNYPYGFSGTNNDLINKVYDDFKQNIEDVRVKLLDIAMPLESYEEIDTLLQEICNA